MAGSWVIFKRTRVGIVKGKVRNRPPFPREIKDGELLTYYEDFSFEPDLARYMSYAINGVTVEIRLLTGSTYQLSAELVYTGDLNSTVLKMLEARDRILKQLGVITPAHAPVRDSALLNLFDTLVEWLRQRRNAQPEQ